MSSKHATKPRGPRPLLSARGHAATTDKTPAETRAEIEEGLTTAGATSFAYASDETSAWIGFMHRGWKVRRTLTLPRREDSKTELAFAQRTRSAWRLFRLWFQGDLERINNGGRTEEVFVADLVVEGGATVREVIAPAIARAAATKALPAVALSSVRALPVVSEQERAHPLGSFGAVEVIEELDDSVPKPATEVVDPDQRFHCRPLDLMVRGRECVARQKQAAVANREQGKAGVCLSCPVGKEVARRLGDKARDAEVRA